MWIVCQIGAREHYAISRALHVADELEALITDFWVPPGSLFSKLPGSKRLKERFHPNLANARVIAQNRRMSGFEVVNRLWHGNSWDSIIARNDLFQSLALNNLKSFGSHERIHGNQEPRTLFAYSYAALELFRLAKQRGWYTVLGQIDPGPEEERIVAQEHERYSNLSSGWQPAPANYWVNWREEVNLADCIVVNSEWSRQCLLKEGVPDQKIKVIPLVYEDSESVKSDYRKNQLPGTGTQKATFKILFLGQINLRKGIGRLLDAMRLLEGEQIELILAGPSSLDPSAWNGMRNVRWIGPVPRSEVERYYRDADIFVLPTLSDGYALTQLEALSYGLPVVASKACGAAVRHGENGWILDDLEPKTIATAILNAKENLPIPRVQVPEFNLVDLGYRLFNLEL